MGDPNAHHLNHHHHLIQHQRVLPQHQLVGGPGAQHLITDPQAQVALAAAPPPMHPQHQFQPQHYNVLDSFWQQQVHEIRHGVHDFKVHQLPLARIKKVMKTDEEVKAPILFAKGCDIFITELTMRAWLHAEECKRRTLQRSDIANAIKKIDMFDFLIDIVPREEKVNVKTEKMEYQDHQSPYGFGMGLTQGGPQFNTSQNVPVDQKVVVDPMTTLNEHQQHLQHMQYMHRMEPQHQQVLHDHPEQHHHHQQPPLSLPPLTPVAGQQVASFRNHARPQYAAVSTEVTPGPSARPVTTEQVYQQHHYYNQHMQQHSSESHQHNIQTQHLDHVQQRQPDHHPVQIKYESESPILRPVDWYPHSQQSYVQGNPHVGGHAYNQPISGQPPHEYHESSGMNLTRHGEGYGRGGGQQRN
ncbi:7532_t:CDS:2 [Gigaspora margarita]|uniref:7532_t:CDS:1 n=1 Tax=Gigaspora margarita TaxID=4874 RepID=A0ABN7V611_GIGMA|nr:7532_t:CDS:2 [Gigaspora margarita]